MKKKFKKLVSVLLSVVMLSSVFAVLPSAMSLDQGLDALRSQWSRDRGPKADGYSIDYSYYSPKKNSSDNTKYPLCIFLAGMGEGEYEGKELIANSFPLWSADENQKEFQNAGGAYLLIARAPEPVYWNMAPTASLKAAIDDFIKKNPNVDTDRIYVLGWCLGAVGATRYATDYPDSVAGIVLMATASAVSASEAKALSNTAVWLVHSKSDGYALYDLYCSPSWNNLKKYSNNPEKLRLTSCESAPDAGILKSHLTWAYMEQDCRDNGGCKGLKTINGNGETVENVRAISWLSQWSQYKETGADESCSCQCHSSNVLTKLLWNIKCFFYKLFSSNSKQTCACGQKHW